MQSFLQAGEQYVEAVLGPRQERLEVTAELAHDAKLASNRSMTVIRCHDPTAMQAVLDRLRLCMTDTLSDCVELTLAAAADPRECLDVLQVSDPEELAQSRRVPIPLFCCCAIRGLRRWP